MCVCVFVCVSILEERKLDYLHITLEYVIHICMYYLEAASCELL